MYGFGAQSGGGRSGPPRGRAAHYLDTLEREPLYMVVFALLWGGDVLHSPKPLIYVFKEFNGFGV
jgi:hypothetical protein